jgi:hypothetical protein
MEQALFAGGMNGIEITFNAPVPLGSFWLQLERDHVINHTVDWAGIVRNLGYWKYFMMRKFLVARMISISIRLGINWDLKFFGWTNEPYILMRM